jgi:hypothetical protein
MCSLRKESNYIIPWQHFARKITEKSIFLIKKRKRKKMGMKRLSILVYLDRKSTVHNKHNEVSDEDKD